MTLKIEKHPEMSRLTSCFKKIETLADDLGLEVDELIIDKFRKVRTTDKLSDKECKGSDWKVIW